MPIHDVCQAKKIIEREQGMLSAGSVGYLQFKISSGPPGGESPFCVCMKVISRLFPHLAYVNEILMGLSRHGFGIRLAMSRRGSQLNIIVSSCALERVSSRG